MWWYRSKLREKALREDATMAALRRILRWPPHEGVKYAYPSYGWFKNNPRADLETFNRGHR